MSKWHAWQTRSWQDTTLQYEHFGNFNATATCYRWVPAIKRAIVGVGMFECLES